MEVIYSDLISAIRSNDRRFANFFDTFGFIVVREVLSSFDFKMLLREYDAQFNIRSDSPALFRQLQNRLGPRADRKYGAKVIMKGLFRKKGMRFLPNFVDGSDLFTDYFLGGRFDELYNYFAGRNWLYLGSDGSNFVTTSFPWHRDWFTKTPLLKFNFYFNPLPYFGGKFLIIPGSNYTQDRYARNIQRAMSWPMQNKNPGGLSENEYLPASKNPRDVFNSTQTKFDVPHVKLNLKKGDLIIFDHRCVHAVQNNYPKFQRRLLTVLLSKNAFCFPEKHHLLKNHSPNELMQEVVDLIVNERNHIGCSPYGDALMRTKFVRSNHFVSIQRDGHEKFNVGEFSLDDGSLKRFHLQFDSYAKIGFTYRSRFESGSGNHSNSQDFSYSDVHLGINAQNIDFAEE